MAYLRKGTLIYTYYVSEFIKEIGEFIGELGFAWVIMVQIKRVRSLSKKEVDILLGSSISTGVDGIPKVCNKLISCVTLDRVRI